jgi:hypothetical protein
MRGSLVGRKGRRWKVMCSVATYGVEVKQNGKKEPVRWC